MADLRTSYMGLELKNPIVPSASPLSRTLDDLKALEDTGAAAVVLYSLFEEQIEMEKGEWPSLKEHGVLSIADATAYFPETQDYPRKPDDYIEHVRKAKEALDIPVIASMNGTTKGGWLDYASKIEEAGADGLELNIYFIPTTDNLLGMDVEAIYMDILRSVVKRVDIPVAVKLSPFFSAFPNIATQLEDAGAEALVLFNRFYQPNIDVAKKAVGPSLTLSNSEDLLLPLRWIAILFGQVDCSLALTSGVHSADDVLKAIMAGANIANVCSVLLKNGIDELGVMLDTLGKRMDELEIASIEGLVGDLSLQEYVEPLAFERASYIKLLQSYGRI
jgi:dihydroorotate dehydrogenase (fumarate)